MALMALVAALVAIAPAPAGAQVRIESALDLERACRSMELGSRRSKPRTMIRVTNGLLVCLGYMQAIQDFAVLTDEAGNSILGACAPPDTTLRQMVRSFMTYAQSHRRELTGSTATVVVQSLRDAYPCDPANSAIRDRGGSR